MGAKIQRIELMKVWQLILVVVIIILGYAVFNWPDKNHRSVDPEIEKIHQQYKPIEKAIDSLAHVIDSLKSKRYDTTIYITKYKQAASVRYLDVTNSVRIFSGLNQKLEDSGYWCGHSLLCTDTVYTQSE